MTLQQSKPEIRKQTDQQELVSREELKETMKDAAGRKARDADIAPTTKEERETTAAAYYTPNASTKK